MHVGQRGKITRLVSGCIDPVSLQRVWLPCNHVSVCVVCVRAQKICVQTCDLFLMCMRLCTETYALTGTLSGMYVCVAVKSGC
jgi:hypothetical protein